MKRQKSGELPYRPCVGIVVFNRDGLVWVGRRRVEPGDELAGSVHLWQMPQGGIDAGESPKQAARRELYEETGIRSVKFLAESPDWLTYDLPEHLVGVALKGRFRGQKQKWFAFLFDGREEEIAIDPPPDGHKAEFDSWAWRRLAEVPDLVVPFKRGVYEEVVKIFGALGA
jgi:putative (di)nucleoside polyphosphate hydrolase